MAMVRDSVGDGAAACVEIGWKIGQQCRLRIRQGMGQQCMWGWGSTIYEDGIAACRWTGREWGNSVHGKQEVKHVGIRRKIRWHESGRGWQHRPGIG